MLHDADAKVVRVRLMERHDQLWSFIDLVHQPVPRNGINTVGVRSGDVAQHHHCRSGLPGQPLEEVENAVLSGAFVVEPTTRTIDIHQIVYNQEMRPVSVYRSEGVNLLSNISYCWCCFKRHP